jgi:tight adherence protein B
MTATDVSAAVAGLVMISGVLLCFLGFRHTPGVAYRDFQPTAVVSRWARSWSSRRIVLAMIAGLVAWLFSGWPAVALIFALTVWGLPPLLTTSRTARRQIDKVEAVEDWTRRLADVLIVGMGLEQAVITTERSAPEVLRVEIGALAARVDARWPLEDAFRALADDIGDATADLVVAALILGHRRRGPGLARALTSVADALSAEVAMRRRIEADRAKPRATARAVTLITLGVVALGALNGVYLAPYADSLGQLVLVAVTTIFVVALAWMRSLTLSSTSHRVLGPATRRTTPVRS